MFHFYLSVLTCKKHSQKYWCPHRYLVRSLEDPAGGSRSGQLFMVGCIKGGYKRRLLQTLNSPYINQTPTRCTGPRESEENDAAARFSPDASRQECIIVGRVRCTQPDITRMLTKTCANTTIYLPDAIFVRLFISQRNYHLEI